MLMTAERPTRIASDLGTIVAGIMHNTGGTPTMGIRLNAAYAKPGTWLRYIDFGSTGTAEFIKHEQFVLRHDGSAEFGGEILMRDGSGLPAATIVGEVASGTSSIEVMANYDTVGIRISGLVGSAVANEVEIVDGLLKADSAELKAIAGTHIGFYGATPVTQPSVSGSSADPVVEGIADALAALGLISRV
jgi:hypothetical protein